MDGPKQSCIPRWENYFIEKWWKLGANRLVRAGMELAKTVDKNVSKPEQDNHQQLNAASEELGGETISQSVESETELQDREVSPEDRKAEKKI